MATYNILSLDGGGTWALIQVKALQNLFGQDTRGHEVLRSFRLVAANSGGSIVAAGLWKDLALSEIEQLFRDRKLRESVFQRLPWYRRLLRVISFGPKYSGHRKLEGLRAILGGTLDSKGRPTLDLSQTLVAALPRDFGRTDREPTDLVIVAFDYDRTRALFFRTNVDSGSGSQHKTPDAIQAKATTLPEAIHASSHAPVNYFSSSATIMIGRNRVRAWDGAIAGFNNPLLVGVTEALANGISREDIRILSIGTGSAMLPRLVKGYDGAYPWLFDRPHRHNLFGDLRKLATSILDNPPDVASYIAYMALGARLPEPTDPPGVPARNGGPIVRMNPMIQPIKRKGSDEFVPPGSNTGTPLDMAQFNALINTELDAVDPDDVAHIEELCRMWLADEAHNQPILASSATLDCEIGQRWYSDARRRAVALGLVPAQPQAWT